MSPMRSGRGKGRIRRRGERWRRVWRRGTPDRPYDYDWIVIGSGFGGAVSALRLAEKGYRVAVIEQGRRFQDHELPDSTRDLRDFLWAPQSGARGILRVVPYKDVTVMTGVGVGGGSLVYFKSRCGRLGVFTAIRSGASWTIGSRCWRRITRWRSRCSAWRRCRSTTRPIRR